MEETLTFKYIIVGDSSVGKSCLLLRYIENRFEPLHDLTIGVEFGYKQIFEDKMEIKIQIWDTGGQERFRSIIRSYFRGAIGALVVFDITKRETFNSIKFWLNEIKNHCNTPINITLVGNKCDLEDKRVISRNEALELANDNDINYIETSGKTGENVNGVFNNNIRKVIDQIKNGYIDKNICISKSKQIKQIQNQIQNQNQNQNQNNCYCL